MANTNAAGTFSQVVSGADRAGLRTSRSCAYVVAIPTCFGQAADDRRHGAQQRDQRHGGP